MRGHETETLKLGNWRWTLCSSTIRQSIPAALDTLVASQRGNAQAIKQNPVRSVLLLPDAPNMIIKHYKVRGVADIVKYLFRRSKAVSESQGERACRKADIPVPDVLAWGENRRFGLLREACLIESRIVDAVGLGQYIGKHLATAPSSHRAQTMRDIGSLLAKIHNAGLSHPDFHPGNILVQPNVSGDAKLFVIDLHSIRPLRLLRSGRRARDLAKLYHSLSSMTNQEALKQMLTGYFATAGTPHLPERTVARLAQRIETVRLRSRTKRCLKESSLFTREIVDGLTVWKRRDWPTEELLPVLRRHEEAKLLRDARLVKESRKSWVTAVQGSGVRYSPRLVVKEPRLALPVKGRRNTVNVMRMRRAWLAAHAFTVRGLLAPQHLALVEKRTLGVPRRAWLISRCLENSQDLNHHLEAYPNAPPEFFNQLTEAVSRLFGYGIYHGDLSGKNILIQQTGQARWQFYFLDLESVVLWRKLTARRQRKNLGQLYRSIRTWCDLDQREYFLSEVARVTDVTTIPDM